MGINMQLMEDVLKYNFARKWLSSSKFHLFKRQENTEPVVHKAEIRVEQMDHISLGEGYTEEEAVQRAYLSFFNELKARELIDEKYVMTTYDLRNPNQNHKERIGGMWFNFFKTGPKQTQLEPGISQILMDDVRVDIECKDEASFFRIFYYLIMDRIYNIFGVHTRFNVSREAIKCVEFCQSSKNSRLSYPQLPRVAAPPMRSFLSRNDLLSPATTRAPTSVPSEFSTNPLLEPLDRTKSYVKYLLNEGLSPPVTKYLSVLIESIKPDTLKDPEFGKNLYEHYKAQAKIPNYKVILPKTPSPIYSPSQAATTTSARNSVQPSSSSCTTRGDSEPNIEDYPVLKDIVTRTLGEMMATQDMEIADFESLFGKITKKIMLRSTKHFVEPQIQDFINKYVLSFYSSKNK